MSEPTQAPTTINPDLTSESDSSSESYPGSFKDNPRPFPNGLWNTASTLQEISSNLLQVSSKKLSRFLTGLNNVTKTYQGLLQSMAGWAQRLYLTEAQEGLVLTVTPEDCLVHWPGTYPKNNNTRLVEQAITLPYQEGSALRDNNIPTKVISNYSEASLVPSQEAFMIRRPLPISPTAPDVRSSDELESNILPNFPKYDGESKGQRRAREKKKQTERRSQTSC
jgi:hypothetical protein